MMPAKSRNPNPLTALGIRPVLGPLEAQIMEIVWERGEVTVRDVYETLRLQRDLAYTTVMTVMHNLHRKGLLAQWTEGNAHVYRPRQSRGEFIRAKVGELLDILLESFSEPALAHFVDRLSRTDPEQLAQLEQLITERRLHEEDTPDG